MPARDYVIIILIIILVIIIVATVVNTLAHNNDIINEADIVIIGCGTAGCILANRLSLKYPSKRIVALERGQDRRNDRNIYNPANALIAAFTEPYSEVLETDTEGVIASIGKMTGGAASHNFGLVVTGSEEFYNNGSWEMLNPDSSKPMYESLQPTFKAINNLMHITPLPISINIAERILPFAALVMTKGAEVIRQGIDVFQNSGPLRANCFISNEILAAVTMTKNVPIVSNYNEAGVSISESPNIFLDNVMGVRSSVNREYLPTASFISNLTIVENAEVSSFNEDIVMLSDGRKIKAKEKIILSAGGIYSPFLLRKSGYSVIVNGEEQIGANLKNHYGCTLIMAVKDSRAADFSSGPVAFVPEATGTNRDWQIVVSGSTLTNLDFLQDQGVDTDELQEEGFMFMTFLLWLMNPVASGFIDASGNKPGINLKLFENNDDNESLTEGLRWLGEVSSILSGQFQEAEVLFPPQEVLDRDNDAELLEYVKIGVSSTDHYSVTCRVGTVLDKNFKLKGSNKIHVVDTSSFPSIPDGNTQYPVMIIAELAARVI